MMRHAGNPIKKRNTQRIGNDIFTRHMDMRKYQPNKKWQRQNKRNKRPNKKIHKKYYNQDNFKKQIFIFFFLVFYEKFC